MIKDIWDEFLTIVRQEVGSRVVETWLKAVSLSQWDTIQKIIYLQAPNAFVKDWIVSNYIPLIQLHLSRLLNVDSLKIVITDVNAGSHSQVACITKNNEFIAPVRTLPEPSSNELVKRVAKTRTQINRNYLFQTFVVGPSNHLAYAAAHAVAENIGRLYNPLFIYGGSGLGKTHLLHAIGNEIRERNKKAQILYQTADRFVNEFINAIRFDKVHAFKAKYKDIDVLLIDDIQFISNKEQTQEAFFHISIRYMNHINKLSFQVTLILRILMDSQSGYDRVLSGDWLQIYRFQPLRLRLRS